jgi:hypothetical protein
MARSSVTSSVLIFFAGLLAHVAGMPQAGPRMVQSGSTGGTQTRNSQAFGPGGRMVGDGSRAFRCPGCDEAFTSEYALRQHRARYSFFDSRADRSGTARSGCALDKRVPIVSRWEAAGQRAGGRVHNTSDAVSKALKGRFGSDSDSGPDSESGPDPGRAAAGSPQPSEPPLPSEAGARSPTDSPSRMRSPVSNYLPSPPPAAAAPGASQQPPLPRLDRPQVRVRP